MSENLNLKASDGHAVSAYLAQPEGAVKGGVVLIQEIFGVNGHIRSVADGYARAGYLVCCPALFDRIEPGLELGYEKADVTRGIDYKNRVGNDAPMLDIAAALDVVRSAGKVGVVGYCWGGALTWLAACKIDGFAAASSYYGGGIGDLKDLTPKSPVIFHFGEQDHAIPMSDVEALKAAQPDAAVYTYPAGHGFNCDQRGSYHAESSAIALERTLSHFAKNLG